MKVEVSLCCGAKLFVPSIPACSPECTECGAVQNETQLVEVPPHTVTPDEKKICFLCGRRAVRGFVDSGPGGAWVCEDSYRCNERGAAAARGAMRARR